MTLPILVIPPAKCPKCGAPATQTEPGGYECIICDWTTPGADAILAVPCWRCGRVKQQSWDLPVPRDFVCDRCERRTP